MQVGDVVGGVDHMEAELVGCSVDMPGLEARAGQPDAEGMGVVIAAGRLLDRVAHFECRCAAELGAEDDEGLIEQAAAFKVLQ